MRQILQNTDLNKSKTFTVSCLWIRRQLHKLNRPKSFENLGEKINTKIWARLKNRYRES